MLDQCQILLEHNNLNYFEVMYVFLSISNWLYYFYVILHFILNRENVKKINIYKSVYFNKLQ